MFGRKTRRIVELEQEIVRLKSALANEQTLVEKVRIERDELAATVAELKKPKPTTRRTRKAVLKS